MLPIHPTLGQLFPPRLLADAAAEQTRASWSWNPVIHPALLILFFIICAALSFYLYRAQARVASRPIIITLTVIRIALIAMAILILLSPVRQFIHNGTSGGSLWLVLDQSASMGQADPQASPVEKLRWADAAGILPPDLRTSALDRQAARLTALRGDAAYLQSLTSVPAEEQDARAKLDVIIRNLKKWNAELTGVADAFEKDPRAKADPTFDATLKPLRGLIDSYTKGIATAASRQAPQEAANDLPWRDTQITLTASATAILAVADKADLALARSPKAADALAAVSAMPRAKLALLALQRKSHPGAPSFDDIIPRQNLKVLAFGDQPQQVTAEGADAPAKAVEMGLASPVRPATDIASALRFVGDHVGQAEPASIVLVTDGRQNKGNAEVADVARRLAARGIRVFGLASGTEAVVPDAAVETLDAPDWVFKGDTVRLSALLRLDGLRGKSINVELHRSQTVDGKPADTLLESRPLTVPTGAPGSPDQVRLPISFTENRDRLPGPGLYDYSVVIADVPGEATTKNNRQTTRVSVKDQKLAALMIEDQPRWEYRYVANYLSRDSRIKLQTVLLQPARIEKVTPPDPAKASPDNPKTEAQLLPETQEEWYKFDVIVLGDLPPSQLSRQSQEFIVKAVTERGATLILLAGPLNMPAAWRRE